VTALVAFPGGVWAFHSFSDVPDDSIFHSDISAIAEAGVTLGFPDGTYRPKDFVTREQMAAFLNRLGALAPGKTPVVNGAQLEGHTAADLSPRLSDGETENVSFPGRFTVITVKEVTVEAPEATGGAVLVEAHGGIVGNGAITTSHTFVCWISTDPDSTESNLGAHITVSPESPVSGGVFSVSFSTSNAAELAAGESTTFFLLCRDISGGANNNLFRVFNAQLAATFLPGEEHNVIPVS
jgi:hypothetical protein